MTEVTCEITKKIGVISRSEKSGWAKEVNFVRWNGAESKIDIREWSQDHEKKSKGITLTPVEVAALLEILSDMRYKGII